VNDSDKQINLQQCGINYNKILPKSFKGLGPKLEIRVEVTDTDKHSSLLRNVLIPAKKEL
jgi:hypothetical protein